MELIALSHEFFYYGIIVVCSLRQAIQVKKQEVFITIHCDRFHFATPFEYSPECVIGFIAHVDLPDTAFLFVASQCRILF